LKKEGEEATEATTSSFPKFRNDRVQKKKQLTFLKHKLTARGHVRAMPFHERFCAPSQHFFKKKVTEAPSLSIYLQGRRFLERVVLLLYLYLTVEDCKSDDMRA